MFNKRRCSNCGNKTDKKNNFCPNCGARFEKKHDNWGLLGEDDNFNSMTNDEIKLPFGFNTLFNSLVKNLDKQFKELDREIGQQKITKSQRKISEEGFNSGGISISISSFGGRPGKIKVKSFGNIPGFEGFNQEKPRQQKKPAKLVKKFLDEDIKKLSKLPKTEPTANVRRLSNKIVYEIDMPEVKSINDVSIIQLENSIEIKAIGKQNTYLKLIPLNLPIINYSFADGKLILELEA